MRGCLVQPNGTGPFSAVVVIHENRGLNPDIEDVARRLGVEGFLALAPDGLAPVVGTQVTTTMAAPCRPISTKASCEQTCSTAPAISRRTACPVANWQP
jgi:dienelactone hydrolase